MAGTEGSLSMTASRRFRSPRITRAAIGALSVLAVVAAAVLPGVTMSPASANTRWQSGVYTGQCGKGPVSTFGSWRHAKTERTSGYVNPGSWQQLTQVSGVSRCLHQAGVPVTLSVAMLPGGGGDLKDGARGAYNQYWRAFGQNAVKGGLSHATLRLGWEFNGTWFKWTAAYDPTHWKAYWRQIVTTLRKVPGEHFTFEWSPGLGANSSNFNPASAYPGNSYVTYVGASVYDVWYGPSNASAATRWSNLSREKYGLNWLASFAKNHHKGIGISEWGLASPSSFGGHGSGDDAYFISHFYAWMKRSNVRYEIYFNRQHGANDHRLMVGNQTNGTFTRAAVAYRNLFGGF
jgi:Glycosyl hydrolase family 26